MRIFLLILGVLSAVLITAQLVMGQLIANHGANWERWVKPHQHSGYTAVAFSLTYIVLSLVAIASTPRREQV